MTKPDSECRIIKLPKIMDVRGNLSVIESNRHVPFDIQRVFYLYDVPGGESRAGHALQTCYQFLIAVTGSFEAVIDDGKAKQVFILNRAYYGLLIPPLYWRELQNFSTGSVCLVLASQPYDENDYLRDYQEFLLATRGKS